MFDFLVDVVHVSTCGLTPDSDKVDDMLNGKRRIKERELALRERELRLREQELKRRR